MRKLFITFFAWLIATVQVSAGGWGFPVTLESFVFSDRFVVLTVATDVTVSPVMTEFLSSNFDSSICNSYEIRIYDTRYETLTGYFFGYTILDEVEPFRNVLADLQVSDAELNLSFIAELGELAQVSACQFETRHTEHTFSNLDADNPSVLLGL